jgi:WXG100 family type VII secretion target
VTHVKVDLDKLYQAERQYRDASQRLRSIVCEIRNSLSSARWEGQARNNFDSEFNAWTRSLENSANGIDLIASQLHQIAESFAYEDRG